MEKLSPNLEKQIGTLSQEIQLLAFQILSFLQTNRQDQWLEIATNRSRRRKRNIPKTN